jgi:serine/threonine-protein kinase SRPK3
MIAIMGPPPPTLLNHSTNLEYVRKYWFDENGKWIAAVRIPDISLESLETRLENFPEEKAEFLRFIRGCLQWDPEMRATAADLCKDPWLKPR